MNNQFTSVESEVVSAKAMSSSINSENVVMYGTPGNNLSLRINSPLAINDEFYLPSKQVTIVSKIFNF